MDIKRIISISDARKRIFEIAEEVQAPDRVYILTENGKPKVAIMSATEYEHWTETLEVDQLFPNLVDEVSKSDAVHNDLYKDWPTLDELIFNNWGFVAADKSVKQYGVHNKTKKRSPGKNK